MYIITKYAVYEFSFYLKLYIFNYIFYMFCNIALRMTHNSYTIIKNMHALIINQKTQINYL